MTELMDAVLQHAKRDKYGNLVLAHLRRHDEDVWDRIAVGEDMQPLVVWLRGEVADLKGVLTRDDGAYLAVVYATPAGAEPFGLMLSPADTWGSPAARMVTIVTVEGQTMLGHASADETKKTPPPLGHDVLRSLLHEAAAQEDRNLMATNTQTADGETVSIVVDWEHQPLRFWLELPAGRELMVACLIRNTGGVVCVALDDELRPVSVRNVPRANR